MSKVDLEAIAETNRTGYPPPYGEAVAGRWYRKLAEPLSLTDFGATDVRLQPGAWSSQRHWHEGEDELLVMIEGEAVLVENDGRTLLRAGDLAAWPKGVPNGHHLINESNVPCRFLAIGKPALTDCHYPDIDMHLDSATATFVTKGSSAG